MTTSPNPSELSLGRRIVVALVGVAGFVIAAGVVTLWSTEPLPLPAPTQIAFGAIVAIGVGWAVFALWSLRYRYPMFGRDRVVAWSIATAGSAVLAGVAIAIGVSRGWSPAAAGMIASIALEGGLAVIMLIRSIRRHRALVARRSELERALQQG